MTDDTITVCYFVARLVVTVGASRKLRSDERYRLPEDREMGVEPSCRPSCCVIDTVHVFGQHRFSGRVDQTLEYKIHIHIAASRCLSRIESTQLTVGSVVVVLDTT